MAIRLRMVDGHWVALCAAETKPEPGDLYLDDGMHEALSNKFHADFETMGFLKKSGVNRISLTIRERKILRLRAEKKTLCEIGKMFKVTPERIRQIEAKAIRKLERGKKEREKKEKDCIDYNGKYKIIKNKI